MHSIARQKLRKMFMTQICKSVGVCFCSAGQYTMLWSRRESTADRGRSFVDGRSWWTLASGWWLVDRSLYARYTRQVRLLTICKRKKERKKKDSDKLAICPDHPSPYRSQSLHAGWPPVCSSIYRFIKIGPGARFSKNLRKNLGKS